MSDIPDFLRDQVVLRAGNRCEYCGLSQAGQEATFHVDHVTVGEAAGSVAGRAAVTARGPALGTPANRQCQRHDDPGTDVAGSPGIGWTRRPTSPVSRMAPYSVHAFLVNLRRTQDLNGYSSGNVR